MSSHLLPSQPSSSSMSVLFSAPSNKYTSSWRSEKKITDKLPGEWSPEETDESEKRVEEQKLRSFDSPDRLCENINVGTIVCTTIAATPEERQTENSCVPDHVDIAKKNQGWEKPSKFCFLTHTDRATSNIKPEVNMSPGVTLAIPEITLKPHPNTRSPEQKPPSIGKRGASHHKKAQTSSDMSKVLHVDAFYCSRPSHDDNISIKPLDSSLKYSYLEQSRKAGTMSISIANIDLKHKMRQMFNKNEPRLDLNRLVEKNAKNKTAIVLLTKGIKSKTTMLISLKQSQFYKIHGKNGKESTNLRTDDIQGAKPRVNTWERDIGHKEDQKLLIYGERKPSATLSTQVSQLNTFQKVRPRLNNFEHLERMMLNLPGGMSRFETEVENRLANHLTPSRPRPTDNINDGLPRINDKVNRSVPRFGRNGFDQPTKSLEVSQLAEAPQQTNKLRESLTPKPNIEFNTNEKAERNFRNLLGSIESVKQPEQRLSRLESKKNSIDNSYLNASRENRVKHKIDYSSLGINPERLPPQRNNGRVSSPESRNLAESSLLPFNDGDNPFRGGHKSRGWYGHGEFHEHKMPEKNSFLKNYSSLVDEVRKHSNNNSTDLRNLKESLYFAATPPPHQIPKGLL